MSAAPQRAMQDDIVASIPELADVVDPEAREGVVHTWTSLLASSDWNGVGEAPAFLDRPHRPHPAGIRDVSLTEHTRHVVWMVDRLAAVCENGYAFGLDRQALLVAALVHDAGKLLTYRHVDGKVILTATGRRVPPSFLSAAAAREAGLSPLVQNLVLAADPQGQVLPDTREAALLSYAKLVLLDVARSRRGEPLLVGKR